MQPTNVMNQSGFPSSLPCSFLLLSPCFPPGAELFPSCHPAPHQWQSPCTVPPSALWTVSHLHVLVSPPSSPAAEQEGLGSSGCEGTWQNLLPCPTGHGEAAPAPHSLREPQSSSSTLPRMLLQIQLAALQPSLLFNYFFFEKEKENSA